MKRRIIAIALCLLMAVSLLPAAAFAESTVVDGFTVIFDVPRLGARISAPDIFCDKLVERNYSWWCDADGDGTLGDGDQDFVEAYDSEAQYYLRLELKVSSDSAFASTSDGDKLLYAGKITVNGKELECKTSLSYDGKKLVADIPVGVPGASHDYEGYDVIWSEGFDTGALPDGWTVLDRDGDGNCWSISAGSHTFTRHCGDGVIRSASYANDLGALTPDNWLICPETKLGKGCVFAFSAKGQDPMAAAEKFGVYVSADGGEFKQLGSDYTVDFQWKNYLIDLSAYEGRTVRVAIVHHNVTDMYILDIDCVSMLQKEPYPFIDVDVEGRHSPYADAILWAANNNITSGYGNGIFKPDQGCTRAQVVTFLWRVAGCPDPKSSVNPFSDVSSQGALAPYYKAILWASESGITTGFNDGSFRPFEVCTRAQFVTFLWRYEGKTQVSIENPFIDVPHNAYYDAIMWAYETGVTKGYGGGLFKPDKDCSRAEVVTFIYRAETS